ncbi:Gfo/Idh/MocA family oxidoreductase [Vagococcus xieshaowenii]|uniref:NAD(P)-dependent oxidoreductase n=1 Tax=Vagococcus xieshaowenii TaxID=2562451 RepID=A0AAJ5JMD5_9ENTE|nr:Gfo/Idh/MocA family oxidoreductase [Vagococcus xieshaowenii]QCA28760.1 NAD(P)-dependent oxidoreductase [Vagococcus xieshaowenii]TFZ43041.1 NAD(P)-dependent oxidoreductase [Vagococcus xieshaowenii]
MLTIAYIGNGKSTNRYHLPFATKVEGINVKKIYARSQPKWDVLEGTEYVNDLSSIWQDEALDLVVITTPPSSHYELAKEALNHHKNVLLEKPFCETTEQAKELFSLAKEKGLHLECYQNRRYDSDFLTVQQVIESGKLGDILEVEMHFDYFRPEVPTNNHQLDVINDYLYSHACHTVDQVISYFGEPLDIHYDVRQLLGPNRMNDYFDLDLFYQKGLKVSVKSSFFRIKERPSFAVYGTKGCFIKATKDRQEEHLKLFYMPTNTDFGVDLPEHYGELTYMDEQGVYHQEKVVSEVGDYSRVYQALYDVLINGKEAVVKPEETLAQLAILEQGIVALHQNMPKYY